MPPAEHASFWKPEAKIMSAFTCNYHPFSTGDTWISRDVICRPRPEFPLPVPPHGKQLVWSLAGIHAKTVRTQLFGSKVKEQYPLMHPVISALPRDQEDILESYKKDPLESEYLLADQNVHYVKRKGTVSMLDENEAFCQTFQPVEEPWLEESLLNGTYATENLASLSYSSDENVTSHIPVSDLKLALLSNLPAGVSSCSQGQKSHLSSCRDLQMRFLFDKDQPIEEPWLLLPQLAFPEYDTQSTSNALNRMKVRDEENIVEKEEQRNFDDENFSSERGSNLLSDQDSISTDILINSSVCTMQRIAVLEDGKLVEILLEPVKNNVQCDSVYIGAVTKLVPHMGGAFVNIGNSRSSLMGINNKREPFIFPPFNKNSKVKDFDAFLLYELSGSGPHEHVIVDDDYEASDDEIEVDVQCGPNTYENDDFEDHDADDDVEYDESPTKDSCVHDIQYDGLQAKFKDLSNHLNGNGSCIKDHTDPPQQSRVQKDNECKSSSRAQQLWSLVRKGTRIVVQVVKEGLGTKAPTLTAYPQLRSRFWILKTRSSNVGTSKKIAGVERARLRAIAKSLRPSGFGLTVRTVAAGHSLEELRKDLEGLLSTWRNIMEHAKSAALAAHEGVEGAVPVILHQARGQTLSVVQDYFTEKVRRMIVDSPRTYHEVTNYLQEIAPDLCNRVELHNKRVPLFDEFNIEEEINNVLNKRVPLPNGGSLVIEQTEALVSIDVNGGHGMFGHRTSQEKAVLDVNLVAAKQIARELRLRDIGGIIVIDFIDMHDDLHRRSVYEEVKKAVERDRSVVKVSELSKNGLMEITRKRVRPSVTFMISEPCTCCHGTGRVEALETSFSKIEHEICRVLAEVYWKADPMKPKSWPRLLLRVDDYMCEYLTAGKKTRLATLSSSLKVWILLKVARSFTRGQFEIKLLADSKAAEDQNQDGVSLAQPSEADDTSGPSKRTKLFSVKKWKIRGKR